MKDLFGAKPSQERTARATQVYAALKTARKLTSHRMLAYRCPRRCLLLDVIGLPDGVVLHSPAYKLSPTANQSSSSAEGRAANTTDGDRRWVAHTYYAQDALNFSLNCDHVRSVVLEKQQVQSDLDARRAEVVIDPRPAL